MTPKQVALVQDSFAKVALTSEAAAVLFYDRLFDIAPQMRAMFPDDMIEQRRKLMTMLAGVVNGLAFPNMLGPTEPDGQEAIEHRIDLIGDLDRVEMPGKHRLRHDELRAELLQTVEVARHVHQWHIR